MTEKVMEQMPLTCFVCSDSLPLRASKDFKKSQEQIVSVVDDSDAEASIEVYSK